MADSQTHFERPIQKSYPWSERTAGRWSIQPCGWLAATRNKVERDEERVETPMTSQKTSFERPLH